MQFSTNGMQHTTSTTMVFQSDDYNKFNMIKGNREIDVLKIKRILSDINRGTNLLKFCPILVIEKNKKLDIIDGQHRFIVAKKIKSPVYYIMAEALSLYDIARMNSNTEKWKAKDFINCYVELGNDNYKKLESFLKQFDGIPVSHAIRLLSRGKGAEKRSSIESFQRGEFVITTEKDARQICNAANAFHFVYKFSPGFLQAISKIIDAGKIATKDLSEKVNVDPDQLKIQDNYKKYLSNLEEIISKGKHKRVQIY
jgi:hypothetical protein